MKLIVALAVVALVAVAPATSATKSNALVGTVGPGFSISLKSGGVKVSKLKAGVYTITVNDKSNIHDFHLTGPGVNKSTSVAGTATAKWKVTLKKGKYHYQCDPHAAFMNGNFSVT